MYSKLRSKFFTFLSLLLMLTGLSLSPAFTPPAMAQTTQNFIFSAWMDVNYNGTLNFGTDRCLHESIKLKIKDRASSLQYIVTLSSGFSYYINNSTDWTNCVMYSSGVYAIQTGKTYDITTYNPSENPYVCDGQGWAPGYSGSFTLPKQLFASWDCPQT